MKRVILDKPAGAKYVRFYDDAFIDVSGDVMTEFSVVTKEVMDECRESLRGVVKFNGEESYIERNIIARKVIKALGLEVEE